jgi:hypothetical protein
MEYEEIISFIEIVELSEDDEPPSGRESIDIAFAFDCVEEQVSALKLNSKRSSDYTKKSFPITDLRVLSNWRWPINNAITSAGLQESMLRYPQRIMEQVAAFHLFAPCITP